MINLEDYTIEDISKHLPKQFDKPNFKFIVCSSEAKLITTGEVRNLQGKDVIINNNKYNIIGVGTYAIGDDREIKSFDLILKLIQKMN